MVQFFFFFFLAREQSSVGKVLFVESRRFHVFRGLKFKEQVRASHRFWFPVGSCAWCRNSNAKAPND